MRIRHSTGYGFQYRHKEKVRWNAPLELQRIAASMNANLDRQISAALLLSHSVLVRVNKVLKSGKRYSNITLLDRCIGFLIQSVAHITISMK